MNNGNLGFLRFGKLILRPEYIVSIEIETDADGNTTGVDIKMRDSKPYSYQGEDAKLLAHRLCELIPDQSAV
jgi:hypothetical protein